MRQEVSLMVNTDRNGRFISQQHVDVKTANLLVALKF